MNHIALSASRESNLILICKFIIDVKR